jgi:SNF2 family DNA or RNA helicase
MSQQIIREFSDILDSIQYKKYNAQLYSTSTRRSFNTQSFIEIAVINEIYRKSLDEYSRQAESSKLIKVPLYAHQLALVAAMEDRERGLRNGLAIGDHEVFWSQYSFLADSVGSGKTIVVLAYIAGLRDKILNRKQTIHSSSNSLIHSVYSDTQNGARYSKLIVVPHTLYRQWQSAIETTTELNVVFCKNISIFKNEKLVEKMVAADAVLVTNTLYQQLQDYAVANNIHWSHIFVDEPDTMHLPSTRPPFEKYGDFIWFITATWASFIINSLPYFFMNRHVVFSNPEIPSIIMRNLLAPYLDNEFGHIVQRQFEDIGHQQIHSMNYFGKYITDHPQRYNLVVRCRDTFRKESMKLPPVIHEILRCRLTKTHQMLNDFLKPEVQMRLHAGDIKGALLSLGVERESETDLISAVTDNQQKELARLQATFDFKQGIEYATAQAKETALAHLQQKIASLQEQIHMFKTRINNLSGELCPICYDQIQEPVAVPCCRQIYCGGCILRVLTAKKSCAMCRKDLTVKDLHHLSNTAEIVQLQDMLSKSQMLLKILQENPMGRFLVFSYYENPFFDIQEELTNNNITVSIVQGNKDVVHSTIEKFNSGHIRVLLMSKQSLYAGLNLQVASHIIFYHGRMSTGEEMQIVGRAQRLGRTTSLKVIKLLHPNEENGAIIAPPPTHIVDE